MIRVAVDAMGGDYAPGEIVKGAVQAAEQRKDIQIVLIGQEEVVREELKISGPRGIRLREELDGLLDYCESNGYPPLLSALLAERGQKL